MILPQARIEWLQIEKVGDEIVVYDEARKMAHNLNPTSSFLWAHCDGQTSVPAMAMLLNKELGVPADEDFVWHTLARLSRAHLLDVEVARTTLPTGITRRGLIKRLAIAGLSCALLPAIGSVVLKPQVAMAQGAACQGSGGNCSGICYDEASTCKGLTRGGLCGCG